MDTVGRNGEDSERGAHRFLTPNHGEVRAVGPGHDLGDTSGGRIVVSSGNSVGGYIHWMHAGDSGPVGGATNYI